MRDLDFIVALMRTERDALGFIPTPALYDRILRHGRYLIQTDGHGRKLGYLLHGPPLPGQPLRVYQACVDLDHRRIKHATRMLRRLLKQAQAAGSTEVLLRCAADLPANAFWLASGFTPGAFLPGGKKRNRLIIPYRLEIQGNSQLGLTPQRSKFRPVPGHQAPSRIRS